MIIEKRDTRNQNHASIAPIKLLRMRGGAINSGNFTSAEDWITVNFGKQFGYRGMFGDLGDSYGKTYMTEHGSFKGTYGWNKKLKPKIININKQNDLLGSRITDFSCVSLSSNEKHSSWKIQVEKNKDYYVVVRSGNVLNKAFKGCHIKVNGETAIHIDNKNSQENRLITSKPIKLNAKDGFITLTGGLINNPSEAYNFISLIMIWQLREVSSGTVRTIFEYDARGRQLNF
ncbi:hypothetical protein PQO03_12040 [Lentisphaera profundi]|uniref:Uncharacterized protein n=1 Tax=Lentisphaera profundi TaxID=1658616 RepID=A0ABY7VWF6_9BACT|nr:hypothetical protein [Lentisphaera profundi]WDE98570.1 hypothetical protein PQO03_12040 [Lentisphaera profundi]